MFHGSRAAPSSILPWMWKRFPFSNLVGSEGKGVGASAFVIRLVLQRAMKKRIEGGGHVALKRQARQVSNRVWYVMWRTCKLLRKDLAIFCVAGLLAVVGKLN